MIQSLLSVIQGIFNFHLNCVIATQRKPQRQRVCIISASAALRNGVKSLSHCQVSALYWQELFIAQLPLWVSNSFLLALPRQPGGFTVRIIREEPKERQEGGL